jgi:hypothetical protein
MTTPDLTDLIRHLREGDWNLRAPQEMADMMADKLERLRAQVAPDGFKLVAVTGFDDLINALDRAERKGYMPDAMAEEWAAFDWRRAASPAAPAQQAAKLPEHAELDALPGFTEPVAAPAQQAHVFVNCQPGKPSAEEVAQSLTVGEQAEPVFHLRSYGDVTKAELLALTAQVQPAAQGVGELPPLPEPAYTDQAALLQAYSADQMQSYARAALAQAPAAEPQWQPIETAPMDGTEFLGYRDGRVASAHRIPRDDCEMWSFGSHSAGVEFNPWIKPTYWMPLPALPAA